MRKLHKLSFLILSLLFLSSSIFGQVVIGKKRTPASHSILQIESNEKGLRHPRLSTSERDNLLQGISDKTGAYGLTIYNTSTQCLEFYKNETDGWINLCDNINPSLVETGEAVLRPWLNTDGTIVAGTAYGKYSYDVAQINFGGSCGEEGRTKDFAITNDYKRTYLLEFGDPTEITDVIVGVYEDPYKIIKTVDGDIVGTVSNSQNAIVVTFADNINELAKGTMENNALEARLYALFYDNGNLRKVECLIRVMDCLGCGVELTSTNEWIPIMCYNLGAKSSISVAKTVTIMDPMNYSVAIEGDSYQWGRAADGHEKKDSYIFYPDLPLGKTDFTTAPANELDANGVILSTSPRYGKFIPTSDNAAVYFKNDWSSTHEFTLWGDGSNRLKVRKGSADPCPKGFRLPTSREWKLISEELEEVTDGWRAKGKSNLFLPKSDYRNAYGHITDAAKAKYWSSCVDSEPGGNGYRIWVLLFNKKGSSNFYDLKLAHRSESGSIRCIKE